MGLTKLAQSIGIRVESIDAGLADIGIRGGAGNAPRSTLLAFILDQSEPVFTGDAYVLVTHQAIRWARSTGKVTDKQALIAFVANGGVIAGADLAIRISTQEASSVSIGEAGIGLIASLALIGSLIGSIGGVCTIRSIVWDASLARIFAKVAFSIKVKSVRGLA